MIEFKEFNEKNYDELLDMMINFYTSEAMDHALPEKKIKKILDDILYDDYNVMGTSIYFDNKLIGFGIVTTSYSTEAAGLTIHLEDLFIKEYYRSKGIAKEYIYGLMDKFRSAVRFKLEVVSTNERAIKLYKKLGFFKLNYDQMSYEREV